MILPGGCLPAQEPVTAPGPVQSSPDPVPPSETGRVGCAECVGPAADWVSLLAWGPAGPPPAWRPHYALVAWKQLHCEGPQGSQFSPRGAGQTLLDVPAYEGVVMDESSRKPPSAVRFWIAMVIVVLLVATVVWFGIPFLEQLFGQAWDRLFGRR
jgi:hypothetical protein